MISVETITLVKKDRGHRQTCSLVVQMFSIEAEQRLNVHMKKLIGCGMCYNRVLIPLESRSSESADSATLEHDSS